MLEKFKSLFRRKIISRTIKEKPETSPKEDGGKLYIIWLLILPVLCGIILGNLADEGLSFLLDVLAGKSGVVDASVTGQNNASESSGRQRGLEGFIAANPFRISPMKDNTPVQEEPVEEPEPELQPDTGLDDVYLTGTFPGIGAWLTVSNTNRFILVGDNLESYKMISVKAREAVFRRGQEEPISKFLVLGAVQEAPKTAAAPPPPAKTAKAPEPPRQTGNITAAVPGSTEGKVPSEIVNQLVQNPFDELKRVRLRPNDAAGGLEIQWIQNDSILKRLGVQRGDVIKSVNGIPFTNMGDIANSISSLMNSERFDVEVNRGGNNTALRYVVQ